LSYLKTGDLRLAPQDFFARADSFRHAAAIEVEKRISEKNELGVGFSILIPEASMKVENCAFPLSPILFLEASAAILVT
jgi:hypothetical protein